MKLAKPWSKWSHHRGGRHTDTTAPVITGIRLRAGKANSGKGAARMVAQALSTARAAGVSGQIIVRGDSAYGSRAVIRVCRRYGAVFSLVLTRNAAVQRAIDAIDEHLVEALVVCYQPLALAPEDLLYCQLPRFFWH